VLLRPANLLCVIPVLICLAGSWRRLALWTAAGLPGALWQIGYNHVLYGSWHSTGYGEVSTSFALHFAPLTLRSYALWLPEFLTPLVVLAFFGPFQQRIQPRARLVLAIWAAAFLLFYAFYWCTYDNWYNMRFVLPAMPAIVILALFILRRLLERIHLPLFTPDSRPAARIASAAVPLLLAALLIRSGDERQVLYWMQFNHNDAIGALWARDHFPPNAVVFARHATGSLEYYTDLLFVRSDFPDAQAPEFFERIARTGRPIFALTYHWERRGYVWGKGLGDGHPDLPGVWMELAVLCGGEIHAWKWQSGPMPLTFGPDQQAR
jgi:hypothetical protein